MMLSQKGNTQVLILILVVIFFLSAFLYIRNNIFKNSTVSQIPSLQPSQTPEIKTYTNAKFGFSIGYPSTLTVREFPDTQDGAGFRPVNKPDDPQYEIISVKVLEKNADMANASLKEYAGVAAMIQIQGYQKLNSIEEVKTDSGLVGYKTTWVVAPPPSLNASSGARQSTISLPITYFNLAYAKQASTVQVSLSDPAYSGDYDHMIKTLHTP